MDVGAPEIPTEPNGQAPPGGAGARPPANGGPPPPAGPQQQGHPPQQQGYPSPQQGYPSPQHGYPPPQQGYPPPQQGYPPPQQGYPPQPAGHPPQQGAGPPPQGAPRPPGMPPQYSSAAPAGAAPPSAMPRPATTPPGVPGHAAAGYPPRPDGAPPSAPVQPGLGYAPRPGQAPQEPPNGGPPPPPPAPPAARPVSTPPHVPPQASAAAPPAPAPAPTQPPAAPPAPAPAAHAPPEQAAALPQSPPPMRPAAAVAEAARRNSDDEEIPGLTRPKLRARSSNMIGDVAIQLGFAEKGRVDAAIDAARMQGKRTGQVLVESGVLTHDQLSRVLAERLGLDHVDLSVYPVDMGAVGLIDLEVAKRYQAVPIQFLEDRRLLLAMADPSNLLTIDDVTMMTGLKVQPAVASLDDIRALLAKQQRLDESVEGIEETEESVEPLGEGGDDNEAPAIRLVHSIIAQAVEQGASDVHFDPEDRELKVLFRVDGVIHPAATMSARMARRVISRVKVMASLNIAERRLPQDGRMAVNVDGRRIDLRIVTLPLADGEGMVMRILDKGPVVQDLAGLGMLPQEEDVFRKALKRHRGAVLVTGPTGSGKSTTLYAAVNEVNTGEVSIITIEDPVESRIAGVKQMAVNPKVGMTFATGLRTMLRSDPDIIMVGEIRDEETATIAVQAAITGHMVLSTLHTNDAPSALGRLADMGVPPFMIASAVDCIVAQRLMRKLCEDCKAPAELPEAVIEQWDLHGATVNEAVGCVRCGGTGYRGRIGVFEVMTMSEEIRRMAMDSKSADEIAAQAVREGMRTMQADGLDKVRAGITSMVELGRVTSLN